MVRQPEEVYTYTSVFLLYTFLEFLKIPTHHFNTWFKFLHGESLLRPCFVLASKLLTRLRHMAGFR